MLMTFKVLKKFDNRVLKSVFISAFHTALPIYLNMTELCNKI